MLHRIKNSGFLQKFCVAAVVSLEQHAFAHFYALFAIISSLFVLIAALRAFNHQQKTFAAVYFEELPVEVLTTLKLSAN